MKLKTSDDVNALRLAKQYLTGKYGEFYTILKVTPVFEKPLPDLIAERVINYGSVRTDCETDEQAQELAKQLKEEFKKHGIDDSFGCLVFGAAVHAFTIYYEMPGSLNYLERTGAEESNIKETNEK